MKMKIALLASVVLLGACAPKVGYNGAGAIGGAVVGSYIGHVAGGGARTVAGGLLGSYIGYNVIKMMGEKRNFANEAFQEAAERRSRGETVSWNDPYQWHSGSYTPMQTLLTKDGVYCRQILETVKISSTLYSNTVQACRNKKGVWVVERLK